MAMSSSNEPVGFWSYTHRDDEIEGGKIRRLVELIANAFELRTGRELRVFLDRTDISWGNDWRERIDGALAGTTFLIPVVTPRFFKSAECRREVITFSGHAESAGLEELLLPIVYVDVDGLADAETDDNVVRMIAKRQWIDWRELRLEDENSPMYRKAVDQMAKRLAEILDDVAERAPVVEQETLAEDNDGDNPGLVERLALMEESLPRFNVCGLEIGKRTETISLLMTQAAAEVEASDKNGAGFAGRLHVSRALASRLAEPVEDIARLSSEYTTELLNIDAGVISLIRQIRTSASTPEEVEIGQGFLAAVRTVTDASHETVASLGGFLKVVDDLAQTSQQLRPVMRSLKKSLQQVIDAATVINEWERLIDEGENDAD